MELIKRTTLHYQSGSSDKVYEVDLCHMGGDRYVVNFRYGRTFSNLREGTKTVQAVPLSDAQGIFTKLIQTKIKKGYQEATEQPVSSTPRQPEREVVTPGSSDGRHQAILNRLASRDERKWSLDRVIWRAGELKIREATPLLIGLLGTGEALRDYCIVWALGWCGDEQIVPELNQLYQDKSVADFVRRIAWEAIFKLADATTKATMQAEKMADLPSSLRKLAKKGTKEAFSRTLSTYLDSSDYRRFAVLDTLYQINNAFVRPALLDVLAHAPLQPNYFKQLRHIFKMAEYRHDGEVFGLLAYRFEKQPGTFNNYRRGWVYASVSRTYRPSRERRFTEELKQPRSKKAYSEQTREYLRRRVWRTLKQLGEEGDADYINLALGVLLPYSDTDAQATKQSSYRRWNWEQRREETFHNSWDAYANYLTFNHILYENSPRYSYHSRAWRCQADYQPGDPEPSVREEAFPELWQKNPAALLQLLSASNCRPVHHFAVKVLRDCPDFCQQLAVETLIELLGKPYEVTVQLGFDLTGNLINLEQPHSDLVLAVAKCILPEARNQAYQWIEQQRDYFFHQDYFLAGLVTSEQAETRNFAKRLLSSSILSDETAKVLIGQIISHLMGMSPNQGQIAREIGEILLLSFAPQLRSLGFKIILDLINHETPEIQEIGARILLNHEIPAAELPSDLIELLLSSPHESVRGVGVRIFGQLPDPTLKRDRILVMAMAVNSVADIRHAIRPVIRRLATNDPEFGVELAIDFIDLLTTPQRHEGVHQDLVNLLREDISGWMAVISKDKVSDLLRSKSSFAQDLAAVVLQANYVRFLPEFTISEVVKLANQEILAVRQAAREMFVQKIDHIDKDSEEMLAAVQLLASKWDDSREFAFKVFSQFSADDWTPQVMVSVCDSVQEDVRRFGRDLVTRYFQADFGHEYLMKFSEHPSSDMQMFATNYLENYATDNPDVLVELMPYFVTVLSQVNRGRVAKERIFNFLATEAQKSELAAMAVAEILTRQSVTVAIGDKARAMQIMLEIKRKYEDIELPIKVKEVVEVRS